MRAIPYLQELGKSYPFFYVFFQIWTPYNEFAVLVMFFSYADGDSFYDSFLQTVRKAGFKNQCLFPECLFSTPISQVNVTVRKLF